MIYQVDRYLTAGWDLDDLDRDLTAGQDLDDLDRDLSDLSVRRERCCQHASTVIYHSVRTHTERFGINRNSQTTFAFRDTAVDLPNYTWYSSFVKNVEEKRKRKKRVAGMYACNHTMAWIMRF